VADEPLRRQQLVELVTDYFETALGPAGRARFEAHLAECPGCEIDLHQLQMPLELVGSTAGMQTAPEVSALLDAFRDWRRSGA
jgi:Putative zinc-finger